MIAAEVPPLWMCRTVPQRIDHEATRRPVGVERHLHERVRVAVRRLRAEQRRGVGVVATHHVAVDHRRDARERHHRMRHVVARAQQSTLFRAVKDEQRRTPARLLLERPRDREDRGTRRGIVVRAVPDRVARHGVTHAVVILVRAEDDILVAQLRVRAADLADHVHRRALEAFAAQPDLRRLPRRTPVGERSAVHEQHGHRCRRRRHGKSPRRRRTGEARHAAHHVVRAALLRLHHAVERELRRRVGDEHDGHRTAPRERGADLAKCGARVVVLRRVGGAADEGRRRSRETGDRDHAAHAHGAVEWILQEDGGRRDVAGRVRRWRDVAPERECASAETHGAVGRGDACAAHVPPLVVAAHVALGHEPDVTHLVGKPDGRAQLIERARLAPAQLVTRHGVEVPLDVRLADRRHPRGRSARRHLCRQRRAGSKQRGEYRKRGHCGD